MLLDPGNELSSLAFGVGATAVQLLVEMERMRSFTSTDILSNEVNSARLSASFSFRLLVAFSCIWLMMMFRRC